MGQHTEQSCEGCTMPMKSLLYQKKKCGVCDASKMKADFTEREWQTADAKKRVCRACMAVVRADAGVLGQRGRLPKEAKNVLLSTSFHSPQADGRHYAASGMPCIVQPQSSEKRAWCELAHQHA